MRHVATFLSCVCLILVLFPWGEVKGQDRAIAPFCDGIKQGVQDNKLVIALADPFRHSGTEEAYRTLKNVLLTSDEPQNLIYCQGGIYNSHEVYEWLQQLVARFSVNEIFLLGMGYDALLNDPRQPWRKLQDDGTLERLPWKEVDHFLVQKPLLDKVHFSLDTQAMSAWYKSVEGATLEQMDGFWKIKSDLSKYNYLYSSDEIPVEAGAQYQINVETELVRGGCDWEFWI